MSQDKLFQAFEKAKASKDRLDNEKTEEMLQLTRKNVPSVNIAQLNETKTRVRSVYSSLLASRENYSQKADIAKLVNHYPMSVNTMKKHNLIYAGMKNKSVLNAYRELRIKLKMKCDGGNATILVSSVAKDIESTTTAMNLAISYSLDQKTSALIIDCNPYVDNLNSIVISEYDLGLTDYVDEPSIGIENIIYQTGIERVSFIPSGSNHERAVELFSSEEMNTLLYELKNRYSDRNIIVNTPPILKSSEARVLTQYCDTTVLTVPFGQASNSDIEDAVSAIGVENIAGVIYQH